MALEMGIVQSIIIIIQLITLVLLLGLLNIYRKSYKEIKIGYTVGLIIFAVLLIVKNIAQLSISLFLIYTGDLNSGIIFQDRYLIPSIIELVAIVVLYKITENY